MGIREVELQPGETDVPWMELQTLKAGFVGRGYVTCEKPYEVYTHWIGRRTLPCMGKECGACLAQMTSTYEGYVSLVWAHNRNHGLVRLTKPAMLMLKNQVQLQPSWRGTIVNFERKGKAKNGRVVVRVDALQLEVHKLPQIPDLRRQMARIWSVDGIEVARDERAYIHSINEFTARKLLEAQEFHAKETKNGTDSAGAAG